MKQKFELKNYELSLIEKMSDKQILEALCKMTFKEGYQDLSEREKFYVRTYKAEVLRRMKYRKK